MLFKIPRDNTDCAKSCGPLFTCVTATLACNFCSTGHEQQALEAAKEKASSEQKTGRARCEKAGGTGGSMKSIGKVMFGAALAVGAMRLAAVPAHAAHIRIGVAIGGPVAYVPPYPGPGYVWVNGYWAEGAWVPGYWNYAGVAPEVGYYGAPGYYREPGYYHDRDWDHDRNWHR